MSEFNARLVVNGDLEHAYDGCVSTFSGLGYELTAHVAPTYLGFKKSGTIWTFDEIDAPHTVSVNLRTYAPDSTEVILDYYCESSVGRFSKRSIRMIESHASSIKTASGYGLVSESPDRICIHCRKGIPDDAEFCNHCGRSTSQSAVVRTS